ncbi:Uncharacterized protein BP5553_00373 [Venustampulla echinocandica]|uniref:Malate dehydrogenase n=1 Tax=Venustampulla echinocandica TaxID=2656787 RepID=A0A370TXY9_9HELO|nr:Uncharacterized protein BP5553_00373 [Venustampulla echinocandica]RDL40394.1 Uncharacterized protein BP5553_00373 [Venustampulla echinocandica]
MLSELWVVSALCAVALSAPTFSMSAVERPVEMKVLSDYFQMLSAKVQEGKKMAQAPVCDLSRAVLPVTSSSTLPAPEPGNTVKHVAIGRGTQNYTCDTTNATAIPVAAGAVATLFNASCVASTYPDLLSLLPSLALEFNLTSPDQETLTLSDLAVSGHHFFSNATTPLFDLNTQARQLGLVPCKGGNSTAAPKDAVVGQNNKGFGAVAWLRLPTRDGAGNVQEVFRVNTAGGKPPAACVGMPATFEVQYAAEYWFFQSS